MFERIIVKTDKDCRKGCHPVVTVTEYKGNPCEQHRFSIDEPGAWWDEEWNCHVDGTDTPFKTREECIIHGLHVLGYLSYEKERTEGK